ncbi:hypothetical protein AAVH_31574 [Aphelenchoides avenae]|nr:hypothetical protein AAVH_31574 [Aphelenchus avenae]
MEKEEGSSPSKPASPEEKPLLLEPPAYAEAVAASQQAPQSTRRSVHPQEDLAGFIVASAMANVPPCPRYLGWLPNTFRVRNFYENYYCPVS